MNEQCNVEFQFGTYKDEILCDIMLVDVFHILLGRPWKYDMKVVHDGRKNTYSLEKMGRDILCHPWKMMQLRKVQDQTFC